MILPYFNAVPWKQNGIMDIYGSTIVHVYDAHKLVVQYKDNI